VPAEEKRVAVGVLFDEVLVSGFNRAPPYFWKELAVKKGTSVFTRLHTTSAYPGTHAVQLHRLK